MKFTLRHVFETDPATYWDRLFFDPDFNRTQYLEVLGFRRYEVLESTGGPGQVRTRKILTEPKAEMPGVVSKLIGGDVTYVEEGRWDPKDGVWRYTITPSKLADKLRIAGNFWVEPRGEKRIERICESDVQVKVFGIGGVVESFIEKTTRDSYDASARFTNEWIRKHGL